MPNVSKTQIAPEDDQSSAPSLARQAAGGMLYIGGSQAARVLLSIGTTIVVARILSPGDYGVVAMWAPIFAFVTLFQDFGFSTATIQASTLSDEQSSTLFWINVLASLVIAFLLIACAHLVGVFFQDARVASVTAASASIVLVGSVSIQHAALLNRDMRFQALAAIAVVAAIISALATIALAVYLRSYWALFLGNLASVMAQSLLTWILSGWRPGRRASLQETRELLGFGSHVATFNIVNFLSRNADNILIGKVWGAGSLGLYDRSYKLMMTPLQFINAPLSRVMLPVLSRLQGEHERFRKAFLFSFQAILFATAPAAVIAAVESEKVVFVLLGAKWDAAAPVFFWLALVMIYQPAFSSLGWLFISCGRGRAYSTFGIVASAATVASFVIGLPGGPVGVAKAYFFVNVAVAIALMVQASRGSPIGVANLVRSMSPVLAAAAISGFLVHLVDERLAPFALLVLSIPISYLITLTIVWLSPSGRMFLTEAIGAIKGGHVPT